MPVSARCERKVLSTDRSRHRRARPDQDPPGGESCSKSHTHTWCHRHGERPPARGSSPWLPRIRGTEPPMGSRLRSRRQGCGPSARTQAEAESHRAASTDQGPIAITTASPSIASPSRSTPTTSPPRRSSPVTLPGRNSAPRASAARIIPAVKAAGCTCAVVSMDPSWPLIETFGDSHPGRDPREADVDERPSDPAIGGHAAVTPFAGMLAPPVPHATRNSGGPGA